MDEISDEFENCPDRIINLKIYFPFSAEKNPLFDSCHQHILFHFNGIFLNLADKVDMDEISAEFENWPNR